MPIYEYTCQSCDRKFEKLVRSMSSRDEKLKCPDCGSTRTARSFSVFAVGGESAASSKSIPPCQRCGGAPGSCGMNK